MDLAADLDTLRSLFATHLAGPVEIVRTLRQPAAEGIALWPWRVEETTRFDLPTGPVPRPPSAAERRHRLHLLVLASDLATLARAEAVANDHAVIHAGARGLTLRREALAPDALCDLFIAAGQPMQAALALSLEG